MNREILFHGKRLDNGEWVTGFLVAKNDPVLEINYCFILAQGRGDSFVTWHKVDPATIGQYTGLTDKNGKRIFEGDILKGASEINRVVRFRFGGFELLRKASATPLYAYEGTDAEFEIIGNIHDNPELLKGGEG